MLLNRSVAGLVGLGIVERYMDEKYMDEKAGTVADEWNIGRLLAWTTEYLAAQSVQEARLSAEVLLSHATARSRIELYTHFDDIPDQSVLDQFRGWVKRAAAREPIAYIVGEKEFFSLAFELTQDVLIPRPETETLVEVVLDHCQSAKLLQPKLLEIGVGSGCISVAVLVQCTDAMVVATDIAESALTIAKRNAERHDVADRMVLVEADKFDIPADSIPDGGFDVVMSNPPYVRADEVDTLEPGVKDFEPHCALTDGADGLSFYEVIGQDCASLLKPDGLVVVEIGDDMAAQVIEVVEREKVLQHVRTIRDRVVGKERVLVFKLT